MEDAGVQISGLGYYPNPLAPDESESQGLRRADQRVISAAGLLGVGVMNTFIGRDWTKSVDDNWPRFLSVWKPIIKFAEDQGVRVGPSRIARCCSARTNGPAARTSGTSPAIWRRMFEAIPSPNFGLNFDPSHFIWQQMDYIKPLWEFGERIFHVHAKDVRLDVNRLDEVGILATPLQFHTPKLPGLGDVNWGRFFGALRDAGYDGPVCIEVEDRAYEGFSRQAEDVFAPEPRLLKAIYCAGRVRRTRWNLRIAISRK